MPPNRFQTGFILTYWNICLGHLESDSLSSNSCGFCVLNFEGHHFGNTLPFAESRLLGYMMSSAGTWNIWLETSVETAEPLSSVSLSSVDIVVCGTKGSSKSSVKLALNEYLTGDNSSTKHMSKVSGVEKFHVCCQWLCYFYADRHLVLRRLVWKFYTMRLICLDIKFFIYDTFISHSPSLYWSSLFYNISSSFKRRVF